MKFLPLSGQLQLGRNISETVCCHRAPRSTFPAPLASRIARSGLGQLLELDSSARAAWGGRCAAGFMSSLSGYAPLMMTTQRQPT